MIIAASLAACAQNTGISDIGLWGSSSDEAATASQTELQAFNATETPPMPSRNPKKRVATPARTVVAAKEKTEAPATERKEEPENGGFTLASLAQMTFLSDSAPAESDTVKTATSPVASYTVLAQRIRECWLAPGTSLSANHGFHADVKPGDDGAAKIIIYEKGADKKRGVSAYKIIIGSSASGSVVTTENHRLDAKLDQAFKTDLARWTKGDTACKG
jgi:hypothetical protein